MHPDARVNVLHCMRSQLGHTDTFYHVDIQDVHSPMLYDLYDLYDLYCLYDLHALAHVAGWESNDLRGLL